ncbi:MAG: hypothetical protein NC416_11515 [Eubacterium sp.]|nr:hypothetical protein [Eubacterium sp.]
MYEKAVEERKNIRYTSNCLLMLVGAKRFLRKYYMIYRLAKGADVEQICVLVCIAIKNMES